MNWGQAPFCQTAQETALPVTTQIPLEEDGKRANASKREREAARKPSWEREVDSKT